MKIERVQQIYAEIEKYHITLASDPASLGPKYLHEQIATCRDYINNVSKFLMEVHRERQNLTAEIHTTETVLAMESDNLRATDDRIRNLPHDKDRSAAVNLLLRTQVQKLADKKAQLKDLEFVEAAVRHRHKELRDTMSEIKLQRSLIRDEIDTKSFYGGERDTHEPAPADEIDGADIDALWEAAGKEHKEARARIEGKAKTPEEIEQLPSTEGMFCGVCGEQQYNSPSGCVCKNGHGGAPTVDRQRAEALRDMAELDAEPIPATAAAPDPADEDAAIADFLAEGDHVGAPASDVLADDDFSDILDNV